jgi:Acetyl-CoA carboxylase, central region
VEDKVIRGLHPMMGDRLQLWRLEEFVLECLLSAEDIYAFRGVARGNPNDERLFVLAEVRDLTQVEDEQGGIAALPELEQVLVQVFETIRGFQARRPLSRRLLWNRVLLHVWPVIEADPDVIRKAVEHLASLTTGLGIESLLIQGRLREPDGSERARVLRFFAPTPHDVAVEVDVPPTRPLRSLDETAQRVISARRRRMLHRAEIVRILAPVHHTALQPAGIFVEHELTDEGTLEPAGRPPATNPSGIVVGTVRNFTERYPQGMLRVILRPTRAPSIPAPSRASKAQTDGRDRRGLRRHAGAAHRGRHPPRARRTSARSWAGREKQVAVPPASLKTLRPSSSTCSKKQTDATLNTRAHGSRWSTAPTTRSNGTVRRPAGERSRSPS